MVIHEYKIEQHLRCPLEYSLNLFSGRWKPRIICVLAKYEKLRYSELRESLASVTDSVLSASLRELEENDIVVRHQFPEIPPRVEYELTTKGKSVLPILKQLCDWGGQYFEVDETDPLTQEQCQNV